MHCYIWSKGLYGAECWTLRRVDQQYLEGFGMWCCRRMEKISWANRARNEGVSQNVWSQDTSRQSVRKT
jgi:hypothetical protein